MRRLVVLLVVAAAALGIGSAPAGAAAPAVASNAARHRPAPGSGAYGAGRRTFTEVDPARGGRSLAVDVWYPTAAGTTGPTSELDLLVTKIPLPGVVADAPVARGKFPLVVFSHGSGGVRYQSWFLLEAMARAGFVVVAPDHTGNTAVDAIFGTSDPFSVIARNRPLDVSFVIDRMLARSRDRADPFARHVDGKRVAVVGHSFGGFTALASASGYQDVPADPRVDAIVPIAAASGLLSDAEIDSIDVPTLLLSGTKDTTVPLVPSTTRVWERLRARPAYRVDLRDAGHNSFTNICDIRDAFTGAGLPPAIVAFVENAAEEGCAPELMPIEQAKFLTIFYTVNFLRSTIGRRPSARFLLSPLVARLFRLPVDVFEKPRGHGPKRSAARVKESEPAVG